TIQWVNMVKQDAPWDLKDNDNTIFGVAWQYDKDALKSNPYASHTSFTNGTSSFTSAADVGNYHAGYTGTYAGISYQMQWNEAGLVEILKNKEYWKLLNPFTHTVELFGEKSVDFKYKKHGMNGDTKKLAV